MPIGLKFQKIFDFLISTGVLYGWGGGWSLPDFKYLEGNLKYLLKDPCRDGPMGLHEIMKINGEYE